MSDVPQHVIDYLQQQRCLTLATTTDVGEPHAATLLYVSDGLDLYVWFDTRSTSLSRVEKDPRVAFAIDEYAADFSRTRGVQGRGRAEPVSGTDMARALVLFGQRFPQIQSSGSTAAIAFYRIRPKQLRYIDTAGGEQRRDEFGFDYHRDEVLGE